MSFLDRQPDSTSADTPVPQDPLAWQRHWHHILDACDDHPDEVAGDKGVPDPLPDLDQDFRLLFNFWSADWPSGAEARKRAFSILPRGDQMLARIEEYLSTPAKAIDAEQATMRLRQGVDLTRRAGFEAPDPDGPVRVLASPAVSLRDAYCRAESPFVELRDGMDTMAENETGEVGAAAYHFLSEPLYRLATTYDVSSWIAWPLCSRLTAPADDPTAAAMRLWRGGWSAGWDDEGLFLYDRRQEFGLAP
ncbi:hypothetical protein [Achromobacter sp. NCFB-sbj8-Ac1-l]|uniref:hypothetical protein n=1 Tax=unclassified Achromobacter TaxID=2626865 RepID=UPI004046CE6E